MKSQLIAIVAAVVLVGCGESQEVKDIQLRLAAEKGNIEAVKKNLADGADVNAETKDGGTPLHSAAGWGQKEITELLIDKGADVNAKDEEGYTPLRDAALRGHTEIAELLIANGADVEVKDNNGFTLLHIATREVAELLIAEGADVNAKADAGGSTPLHLAAMRGHKETAELLIAKGADVNAKYIDGKTPLDWAIEINRTENADLLRKHGGKTGEELKAEGK